MCWIVVDDVAFTGRETHEMTVAGLKSLVNALADFAGAGLPCSIAQRAVRN